MCQVMIQSVANFSQIINGFEYIFFVIEPVILFTVFNCSKQIIMFKINEWYNYNIN